MLNVVCVCIGVRAGSVPLTQSQSKTIPEDSLAVVNLLMALHINI